MLNHRQMLLLAALLLTVFGIVLLRTVLNTGPKIEAVAPDRGASGDVIAVTGSGFGSQPSRVYIGNRSVPRANIREWADTRIRFSVPGAVYSGLVRVHRDGTESNSVLFTNTEGIPQSSGGGDHSAPFIYSASPNVSAPGREVTISGRNFGVSKTVGRIIIQSAEAGRNELRWFPAEYTVPQGDITLWSQDTIRFYAPSGIIADTLLVETAAGRSDQDRFELQELVGTFQYRDPQEIAFGYTIAVSAAAVDAGDEHADSIHGVEDELVVWLPSVAETATQRSAYYTRLYPEARFSNQRLLKFVFPYEDIKRHSKIDGSAELIRMHGVVERYAVETTLLPSRVANSYQQDSPLYRDYLADAQGIELTSAIRSRAASLGGASANPLTVARNLFAGVRNRPDSDEHTSSLEYAADLTALLRARGIPARIVTGILLPPGASPRYHHWVEWYVIDFGWVPMDPFLANAIADELPWAAGFTEEPGYYSENLDAFRVTLHTGAALPPRVDSFSSIHQVENSPLPVSGIAYGHLSGLAIELRWGNPFVMYRSAYLVGD